MPGGEDEAVADGMDPCLDLGEPVGVADPGGIGIAVVGCGGIVNDGHLPAYAKHDLSVLGCFDVDPQAAQRTANQHGIPQVYESLEALAADPAVDIVDVAVPPWEQVEVADTLIAAGKHLLCQKPLSNVFSEAVQLVEAAERAEVLLAVNQQFRWSPAMHASKTLIGKNWIGQPTEVSIQESMLSPWHLWPWLASSPVLEIMYHSIHYLDAMRYLFGEPEWVTSRHTRYPGDDRTVGETKTITILDYASGLQALVTVNHSNHSDDVFGRIHFLGTEGVITGTLGLSCDYPDGREDTLEWSSWTRYPEHRFEAKLEGKWIPDAFIGPMASLIAAVRDGRQPPTSGRDNLNTLRIVGAAYRSAAENRSVRPEEIG